VLVIVLVALVGLSALAAAGMVMTETELRASENQEAGTSAFYAADAGMQEYLGTREYATTTDTFTYSGGTAIVQGEKLLDMPTTNGDQFLYRVRSVSSYTPPEGGTASRTLSRLASDRRQPGLSQLSEAGRGRRSGTPGRVRPERRRRIAGS
jgi:hypothetical protein